MLPCDRSTAIQEGENTTKQSNSRPARKYTPITWNKNCCVLTESNKKLYRVLKWHNKYTHTMCDRFYRLTCYFPWTFEAGCFLTDMRIDYFGNTMRTLHSHGDFQINFAYSINYFIYYKLKTKAVFDIESYFASVAKSSNSIAQFCHLLLQGRNFMP